MLTLYDRNATIGGFRALLFAKAGAIAEASAILTLKDAKDRAESMARQNPGQLVEVVEVDSAFKGATQVSEVKPMPSPPALPSPVSG